MSINKNCRAIRISVTPKYIIIFTGLPAGISRLPTKSAILSVFYRFRDIVIRLREDYPELS